MIAIVILLFSCNRNEEIELPAVNLDHLMHLYDVIDMPGNNCGGIVRIYSEYPDYAFEIEPNEGFTCVDDVARAMMIDAIRFSEDEKIQANYEFMAEFLLYMQAENGWFNNFIWHDLSINKTYRTSIAEPNWWSWRAFWALSNYNGKNEQQTKRVKNACNIIAENIFHLYLDQPLNTIEIEGVEVPTWLPLETAGDQAAVLILGLEAYYSNVAKDKRALQLIKILADGLVVSQQGNSKTVPFGAFMSWQNMWHAYGNSQAFALLKAGSLLDEEDYIKSALLEIDHFYLFLMSKDYPAFMRFKKADDEYEITERQLFPQIAYNYRPMIWACMEAFKYTGKNKYSNRARKIASWFTGNNIAGQQMYDPLTGRCFDGIISEKEINKNSGAESTIEALLSLQVFDQTTRQ